MCFQFLEKSRFIACKSSPILSMTCCLSSTYFGYLALLWTGKTQRIVRFREGERLETCYPPARLSSARRRLSHGGELNYEPFVGFPRFFCKIHR